MKTVALCFSLVAFCWSCKKEPDTIVWYRYMETQCGNPFEVRADPAVTRQKLSDYLVAKGIMAERMESRQHGKQCALLICSCAKTNGYYHFILINKSNSGKAEELGLTQNNP